MKEGAYSVTDIAHELMHVKQFAVQGKHYSAIYRQVRSPSKMHLVLEYDAWKGLSQYADSYGLNRRYIRTQVGAYRQNIFDNRLHKYVQ